MTKTYRQQIKVYYDDTDAGGVVYHANYLKFVARTRSDWCSSLGFCIGEFQRMNIMFAVVHADVTYRLPALLGDTLEINTSIEEMKRSSMKFHHEIINAKTEKLLCVAKVTVVAINGETLKSCRIPKELVDAFE